MPATAESMARTRALARVIGPFLTLVVGAFEVRAAEMGNFVQLFFENVVLVWVMAAMLVLGGLLIVAFHQYWRSPAAVVISLFGWFLLLRGLVLMYAPQLMARAAGGAVNEMTTLYLRLGFGAMLLVGLWLSYVGWMARVDAARGRS